jgi:hypothetical protein
MNLYQFEPDGRSPGRDLTDLRPQIIMSPNVGNFRSWCEHRRAPIWLSGMSECEWSETRGPQGYKARAEVDGYMTLRLALFKDWPSQGWRGQSY